MLEMRFSRVTGICSKIPNAYICIWRSMASWIQFGPMRFSSYFFFISSIRISFLKFYFLIGRKLLYHVALVPAVQQCKSAIIIHISLPSWTSLPLTIPPSRSSHCARLDFLCYVATSHQLSVSHMVVYICWRYFLHLPHSFFPLLCPQVCSLYLCLQSFPANRFIIPFF